jgi:energy-coupling factor transport system permease protein
VNLLLPGMYVAADSPLHRLDPRVKLGASLLLMALPFAARNLASQLLLIGFVTAIVWLSRAPLLALLRTLRTIFWIGFFMFFFFLFTTPGQVLIEVRGITLTWQGLLAGATQIYRLCLLVIITSLLTFTTSPTQLAHGLESLLGLLKRLRLPVAELVMVLTIALRFVPTFFEEIEKIGKAQRARGADFHSGKPWRRIQGWVTVFVPIFVSAFRRAEELAIAMEARGFRGAQHRTRLYQLSLTYADLLACLIVLALSLAALTVEQMVSQF